MVGFVISLVLNLFPGTHEPRTLADQLNTTIAAIKPIPSDLRVFFAVEEDLAGGQSLLDFVDLWKTHFNVSRNQQ
jgi:hypothetical protein